MQSDAHPGLLIGRYRIIDAQVVFNAARASGDSGEPHFFGEFRQHLSGHDEAVLRAGVIVVDRFQRNGLGLYPRELCQQVRRPVARQIARDASGNDLVHEVAMTEQLALQAQQVLLQPPELKKAEREPDVAAEVAEIAQVVGDALEFEHDSPETERAAGRLGAAGALDCHGVGPGVSDGGITGHTPGEFGALGQGHGLEKLLYPFVRVAQALFQAQDFLAHDGEAEMPRFDGAGVHRAYRYFVYAFAFDLDERIAVVRRREARADVEFLAQRKYAAGPGAVAHPLAVIRAVLGVYADKVVGGALHSVRARIDIGDAGIARVLARERQRQPQQA